MAPVAWLGAHYEAARCLADDGDDERVLDQPALTLGGAGHEAHELVAVDDFAALIGPRMFRRWVLPALEEEAALVGHAYFHWDGPDALKHMPDLLASPYFHTIGYVPGKIAVDGSGDRHPRYIALYQAIQAAGKSVHVWGTPDELMYMHRHLRPEKTLYTTTVTTQAEAEALLDWFTRHT